MSNVIEDAAVNSSPLMNRRQGAAYLAISQRKFDQLVASREIARVKFDNCVRFRKGDLDTFIESRKSA